MIARGYERDFAERCFKQIEGFGDYGFPESHAASFALLVYVSAWIKCHYPAVFAAALLNSQPMGFYAPAQIVRDVREHGVEVRHPDANDSDWDCTLEPAGDNQFALRLGLRQIKGFKQEDADRLSDARRGGYRTVAEIRERAGLRRGALERLARADAFQSLGLDRRRALWAVTGFSDEAPLPLFAPLGHDRFRPEPAVVLPEMAPGEQVADDYRAMRLSLKAHPVSFLRDGLAAGRIVPCGAIRTMKTGARVRLAGLVLIRQRPGSAKGVIFVTIEDETGTANLIVWPHVMERYRRQVLGARLLGIDGKLQRQGIVTHVVAERLFDYSDRLGELVALEPEPAAASGHFPPGEDKPDGRYPAWRLRHAAEPEIDRDLVDVSRDVPGGRHPSFKTKRSITPRLGHPRDADVIPGSRDFR
jgi:error-prone DNA polymerase